MLAAIKEVIEKHIWAHGPNRHGCVGYLTKGVVSVADELGISFKAADELVRDWIGETF